MRFKGNRNGKFWGTFEGRLWDGNECGRRQGNGNLKATIPSTLMIDQKQLKNVEY